MTPMLPVGLSTTVTVGASSANLGPGFDSLALALGCYDTIIARTTESDLTIQINGEGAGQLPLNSEHLVVQGIQQGLEALGITAPGLALSCHNKIPHQRGLGSSAAAVVGGLGIANGFAAQVGHHLLDTKHLIQIASEFEGHPDNAAAAILGGAIVSWVDHAQGDTPEYHATAIDLHPDIHLFSAIPQLRSSTSETRMLLPAQIPHRDARFNLSRSALLVVALTTQPELLFAATEDALHQSYRASVQPHTGSYLQLLRRQKIPAVLSGAGPAIIILSCEKQLPKEVLHQAQQHFFDIYPMTLGRPVQWNNS